MKLKNKQIHYRIFKERTACLQTGPDSPVLIDVTCPKCILICQTILKKVWDKDFDKKLDNKLKQTYKNNSYEFSS